MEELDQPLIKYPGYLSHRWALPNKELTRKLIHLTILIRYNCIYNCSYNFPL
jgi:hypothetical protein